MDKRTRRGIAVTLIALVPSSALAAASPSCPITFSKLRYSASFELKSAKGKKMTLELGSLIDKNGIEKWVAQIRSNPGANSGADSACQAICRTKRIFSSGPQVITPAVDLECSGTGLEPLSVPASLVWSARPGAAPVLRFGSWLQGYREAPLHVELDRLTTQRQLAQIP